MSFKIPKKVYFIRNKRNGILATAKPFAILSYLRSSTRWTNLKDEISNNFEVLEYELKDPNNVYPLSVIIDKKKFEKHLKIKKILD